MNGLFQLRGELSSSQKNILAIIGIVFILGIWIILTSGSTPLILPSHLPHPLRVWNAFGELYSENEIIMHLSRSIGLNLGGYIKSILYALIIGFALGLIPLLRGAFQRVIDAIRFLPLTAVTGLFILWFGIQSEAKINFLAFGIFIYLLPVVIQRIDEVDDVYLKTVKTLGASYWQTIRTVYVPAVISKLSDDIRILTAISWTYIIVAETNASNGGIGYLIYGAQRLARVDKIFACLIIIMAVGIFQDKIFAYLDRKFFPYKYQIKESYAAGQQLKQVTLFDAVFDFIIQISTWLFLSIYLLLMVNEYFSLSFFGNVRPLHYLFDDTVWTVHTIFLMILSYQLYKLIVPIFKK